MNIKNLIPVILTALFISVSSFASNNTDPKNDKEVVKKVNENEETIVGVAASNKNFTTLVAAVKAAELVEVLAGEGPYTVFAPVNSAFDKLPKGTVETLLKPGN